MLWPGLTVLIKTAMKRQDNETWIRLEQVNTATGHNANFLARYIGLLWSDNFPLREAPDNHLILSVLIAHEAELAVPYSDDILNPFLRGAILLLKKHGEQDPILLGNIYLVDIQGMRLFRIVKKHDLNPESLCLSTTQPAVFGDMIVPAEQISGLWQVMGAVSNMVR